MRHERLDGGCGLVYNTLYTNHNMDVYRNIDQAMYNGRLSFGAGDISEAYYTVGENQKALASIRSLADPGPAYEVDFSAHYATAEEARAVQQVVYGKNSIYLSQYADADMLDDTNKLNYRSMAAYAGVEEGSLRIDIGIDRDLWDGFAAAEAYQKMARQGGTRTQADVDELLAAAESYRWKYAYQKNDVYEQDMFDFADSIKEQTGVTLTTSGMSSNLSYQMDGLLCTVDNYTFQLMAQHQEHMDLWGDMVSGKYRNFGEAYQAVLDTGDEQLKNDWDKVMIASRYDKLFESKSANLTAREYASVTWTREGFSYDDEVEGRTAQDFWQELNYNLRYTNAYESKRSYDDYIMNGRQALPGLLADNIQRKSSIPYAYVMDEEGNEINPKTGEVHKTAAEARQEKAQGGTFTETEDERVEALQKKIAALQSEIAALQGKAAEDEEAARQLAANRQKVQAYENQISLLEALQAKRIEDAPQMQQRLAEAFKSYFQT